MGDEILSLLPFALIISLSGFISGYMAGLLGVGGGIVIVPVLYYFLSLIGVSQDIVMHISVATSLAVIIPTGWRSYQSHKNNNSVDNDVLKAWLFPTMLGSVIGANIAGIISEVLVLGAIEKDGKVVLVHPSQKVENGLEIA